MVSPVGTYKPKSLIVALNKIQYFDPTHVLYKQGMEIRPGVEISRTRNLFLNDRHLALPGGHPLQKGLCRPGILKNRWLISFWLDMGVINLADAPIPVSITTSSIVIGMWHLIRADGFPGWKQWPGFTTSRLVIASLVNRIQKWIKILTRMYD